MSPLTSIRPANGNSRRVFKDVTNSSLTIDQGKPYKNALLDKVSSAVEQDKENSFVVPIRQPVADKQPLAKQIIRYEALKREKGTISTNKSCNVSRNSSTTTSYQYSKYVDDIDARDTNDPQCATEYVKELYLYFSSKEMMTRVRPNYMEHQAHINERMRSILIDWVIEVHFQFNFVPETLYLTVTVIDRYLEHIQVTRPNLQLVGVTSLLIASKYEEIYPPELHDLIFLCDGAYSRDDIMECEERILNALHYQITNPSAHAFLVRYLKASHSNQKMVQLSCFILDGTLVSYSLLNYLPSQLAAASVFLGRRCVGRHPWSPTLLKYANYCEEDVTPVAKAIIAEKLVQPPGLRAVNKKYCSKKYGPIESTVLTSFHVPLIHTCSVSPKPTLREPSTRGGIQVKRSISRNS